MSLVNIVDIVPNADSAESAQNSEPSIAVNPVNPMQIIAATFGASDSSNPFFASSNGGATWSDYGTATFSDKSIAWALDGSALLSAALSLDYGPINTYLNGNFTSPINTYVGLDDNDQPWIRTGSSNSVYIAYNNLGLAGPNAGGNGSGMTASVLVSTQGGASPRSVTLDNLGTTYQDDPAVRLAVNSSTVYAVFDRWSSSVTSDASGDRYNSQLVVMRSNNGGADDFTGLGTYGVEAASHIGVFVDKYNTALTLGQERIAGGDLAIAVDPNNASRVIVAYTNSPSVGVVQLVVTESVNAGQNWTQKFVTPAGVRSGQPALAILANGTVGLLYNQYQPLNGSASTGTLSQCLLTTTNDFASVSTTTLASESNSTPTSNFQPYLGDFFDLTAIGNTFYGIFSASNQDDGTHAQFTNVNFGRNFTGIPGTSSFQLLDTNGSPVAPSIDPFFFSFPAQPISTGPNAPPPAATTADMILSNASAGGFYQIYDIGNNAVLASYQLGQVGTDWQFAGLGNFFDGDSTDMMLRNFGTGGFQVYDISNNNIINSNPMGAVGLDWQVSGFGRFSQSAMSGMMLRNSGTGAFQVYGISNNSFVNSAALGAVGLNWQGAAFGNFSSLGETDMILSNTSTGGLQVYDISNNQITNSALIGTVGTNWQSVGAGNFSSNPGESDLMMRNTASGAFEVYDIANNQITAAFSIGVVGLDWQVAGFGPISGAGQSDMVLRNMSTGAFQVYDISNNMITATSSLGAVGLDWQLGGFAVDPPTGSSAWTNSSTQVGQLVQAMAGLSGDTGTTESLNSAAAGVDTTQQPLLTTPQHG
jgi:hypothetical protein